MMNIVERTKDAIDTKLNEFFEDLTKGGNKKTQYQDLLKKNITKSFYFDCHNPNWSNLSSDFELKVRPETAKPSNLKAIDNLFEINTARTEEAKGNKNTISFCGIRNSLNGSPEDSLPSSPTFYPGKKKGVGKENILNEAEFCTKESKLGVNLTKYVWPKSRTLLSIVSKMFVENIIDEHQRGCLKELIMDHDERLIQILQDYEIGGDYLRLYECIRSLSLNNL
jgi:hypothetical protein